MKTGYLIDRDSLNIIIPKVLQTTNFFERGRGLLAKRPLTENEGMLIVSCNSIHTFFMGYSLDIIYFDKKMRITSLHHNIRPWRFCTSYRSSNVLEARVGSINKFSLYISQKLEFKESSK